MKRAAPSIVQVKRKKVKIGPNYTTRPVSKTWQRCSDTGRLDMYTEQLQIYQSATSWYDDIFINS